MRAVLEPYAPPDASLAEELYQRRTRARGPHVVAIGGGTGLSTLLRGLKEITSNITAVVTVADDGGSSGRLRDELGVPPMGDIRNCIVALADAEPQMADLLQYRFPTNGNGRCIQGPRLWQPAHRRTDRCRRAATSRKASASPTGCSRCGVRSCRSPPAPLMLHAELADGSTMDGQSQIMRTSGIRRVWITPDDVRAADEAVDAIATADLVIYGPGSLYTSILPSLLVPGMREALERTSASRLFVCNVATQVGETEGYSLADHVAAFRAHGLDGAIDADPAQQQLPRARRRRTTRLRRSVVKPPTLDRALRQVFLRDVVDNDNAHRHDSAKLAAAINLLQERHVIRRRPAALATPTPVAA